MSPLDSTPLVAPELEEGATPESVYNGVPTPGFYHSKVVAVVERVGQLQATIAEFGTSYALTAATASFPSGNNYLALSSMFSGWASPVGVQQDFQAVGFSINWWSTNYQPPAMCRVRVRENDETGAILGDVTFALTPSPVSVGPTGTMMVTAVFPAPIANVAGTPLWLEFNTDGNCAPLSTNPQLAFTVPPFAHTRYSTNGWEPNFAYSGDSWNDNLSSESKNIWCQFGSVVATVRSMAALVVAPFTDVGTCIPTNIYATPGIESNVYLDGFVRAHHALGTYRFDVACEKGQQDEDRWTFLPVDADAGSYAWQCSIYFAGELVKTVTTTLVVSADAAGTGVTRKLLGIGDSTMAGGFVHAQLAGNMVGDALTVTQLGTITGNILDFAGVSRAVKHEGRAGWTFEQFYTDAESPFVFTGVFDFAQYLTTNSLTMAADDWVYINLGINDTFIYTDDVVLSTAIGVLFEHLDGMIASIKAAVSGVRIALGMVIPPALSQNAFGVDYDSGQTRWRYNRNRLLFNERLLEAYDGVVADVYCWPIHLGIDAAHNFPVSTEPYNARNAVTFVDQSSGVHPAVGGYYQHGDQLKACLKAGE